MEWSKKPPLFSWYLIKYLSLEILFSFFSGTLLFLAIMLSFQAIRLSEFVVVHQVSLRNVLQLGTDMSLSFLPIAVPIAFLFAVLMGISRASAEGEILALEAGGWSTFSIFTPVATFAALVTLVCLYTSFYTVPRGNRAFEVLFTRLGNERVIAALRPGVFQEGFFGLTLLTEQIIPVRNELKNIFIYDHREEDHPLTITAQAGLLKTDLDKGVITLRLTNGSIHVEKDGPVQQKIDFQVHDINLDLGQRGNGDREYSPPSYTYDELRQRLEVTPDPIEKRYLNVELHRRFSLAFSCFVFGVLGFFLGVRSRTGVRSTAVLLCLGVALLYWTAYLAANALAIEGTLTPWIGIWLPNLAFLALGYRLYRAHVYR